MIDYGDGTYSATMTNTVAEDVTVSATIDGHDVVDTADVTFIVGGGASAINSRINEPQYVCALSLNGIYYYYPAGKRWLW